MVARGAMTCTISASSTSSPNAYHGWATRPASEVFTRSGAAGRPNTWSNRVMSWRMLLTSGSFSAGSASSGSTTVSPRPSMPRSSSGLMP